VGSKGPVPLFGGLQLYFEFCLDAGVGGGWEGVEGVVETDVDGSGYSGVDGAVSGLESGGVIVSVFPEMDCVVIGGCVADGGEGDGLGLGEGDGVGIGRVSGCGYEDGREGNGEYPVELGGFHEYGWGAGVYLDVLERKGKF